MREELKATPAFWRCIGVGWLKSLILTIPFAMLVTSCGGGGTPPSTGSNPIPKVGDNFKSAFGVNTGVVDTDNDGLSDDFEILYGYPLIKPNMANTDGIGPADSAEDSDKDGLDNLQEQKNATYVMLSDSDGDGLSDGQEVNIYKTNPIKIDSDGDGITDDREIANGTNPNAADADRIVISRKTSNVIIGGAPGLVSVAISGSGDIANSLNTGIASDVTMPGQISKRFDLSVETPDKVQYADITLPYDRAAVQSGSESNLIMVTVNPTTNSFEILGGVADSIKGTLTARTNHFSQFFIANKESFISNLNSLPQTCDAISSPSARAADVALVVDSSGSMTSTDPTNLRITAAKNFVAKMKVGDRTAVIDFDDYAKVLTDFTGDISTLNAAINKIDSSGGTNISDGISQALALFASLDKSKENAIIMLTDGDGTYDNNLTLKLKSSGIRVFAIGLTGSVNEPLLRSIADNTNGGYKKINDASGLINIFDEFSTVFGDTGKDTDNDGLTDCQETQGIYLMNLHGKLVKTSPTKSDTDGDGLSDSTEIGLTSRGNPIDGYSSNLVWKASGFSDPTNPDTDADSLSDDFEYAVLTNSLSADSDSDGIKDNEELNIGTDPTSSNTDGDDYTDLEETKDLSLDPLTYNYNSFELFRGMAWGMIAQDWLDSPNTPEFVGMTVIQFVPIADFYNVPVNLMSCASKSDAVGCGLTIAGILPVAGDTAKISGKVAKLVEKNQGIIKGALKYIEKHFPNFAPSARTVLKLPIPGNVWKSLSPFDRGRVIEKAAAPLYYPNSNILLGNFPKIDCFENGKAISIKTIDLDAKTYITNGAVKGRINHYLTDLNDFKGAKGISQNTGMPFEVKKSDITSKELFIGLPYKPDNDIIEFLTKRQADTGISIRWQVIQ